LIHLQALARNTTTFYLIAVVIALLLVDALKVLSSAALRVAAGHVVLIIFVRLAVIYARVLHVRVTHNALVQAVSVGPVPEVREANGAIQLALAV